MATRLFSEPIYKLTNTISTGKFYWVTQTIDIFFDDVHFKRNFALIFYYFFLSHYRSHSSTMMLTQRLNVLMHDFAKQCKVGTSIKPEDKPRSGRSQSAGEVKPVGQKSEWKTMIVGVWYHTHSLTLSLSLSLSLTLCSDGVCVGMYAPVHMSIMWLI